MVMDKSSAAPGVSWHPGRTDLQLISGLVTPRARVLDLGCGDGSLLKMLTDEKKVIGRGVELSYEGICDCVDKGLSVHHGDLDEGLGDYPDQSFDYVIVSQTLQALRRPEMLLREALRVGKVGIVSFPNFAYWKIRWQLLSTGRMPKTDYLPYEWYDTPNIHLLTIKDFRAYCASHDCRIEKAIYLTDGHQISLLPNLRAKLAIMVIGRCP